MEMLWNFLDHFRFDSEIVISAIKTSGVSVIDHLHDDMINNDEIIEELWQNIGGYENAPQRLQENVKFSMKSLTINPKAFEFAPHSIRNNRMVVKRVLEQDGSLIKFVSDNFQKDFELVKLAISKNPKILELAHQDMKRNKELLKYALDLSKNEEIPLEFKITNSKDVIIKKELSKMEKKCIIS